MFCLIGGLAVSAYFVGYENFKRPNPRTTDETVYYTMAYQMEENIFAYNATAVALYDMITLHKKYPAYFHKPLFKHPPLFTLMVMASIKMFGPSAAAASFTALFFWALSIVLIYFFGASIGGRAVGLMAAAFLFIDPVTIMSSQKVWMDTPLMLFMLLTVYAYWKGLSERQDWYFILGGLAAGAAFMTKYPGLLSFFAVVFFTVLCYPKAFRNRYFLISLGIPVVVPLPWFLLNYYVYGFGFIHEQLAVHSSASIFSPTIMFLIITGIGLLFFIWKMIYDPDDIAQRFDGLFSSRLVFCMKLAGFIGTAVFILVYIGKSLDFFEVPAVTWQQASFSGQPRWFYFQRLLRFCFLYGFSYLAFFDPFSKKDKGRFLLKLNAFLIFVFFAAWGNFQCRYILPALPFLMILSVDYIWGLLGNLARMNPVFLRLLFQAAVLILIVLAVSKTMLINFEVSYPNNMCYF